MQPPLPGSRAGTPVPPAAAAPAPAPDTKSGVRIGTPGPASPRSPEPPTEGPSLPARKPITDSRLQVLGRMVQGSLGDPGWSAQVTAALGAALQQAAGQGHASVAGSASQAAKAGASERAAPTERGDLRPVTLDWSGLRPQALARLGPEVGRCLDELARQQGVALTRVQLPGGLGWLPPALGGLQHLAELDLPAFQGDEIDTRQLRPDGAALRVDLRGPVHLTRLYRRPHHDLRLSAAGHMRIQEVVEDPPGAGEPGPGKQRVGKLSDRFYARLERSDYVDDLAYREDYAHTVRLDLNGKVRFPGTEIAIVCRHLAVATLYERLRWDADPEGQRPRAGRFSYRNFATPGAIEQAVGFEWEQTFSRLRKGSVGNHLVAVPRLGEFLGQEFGAMRIGQSRHFLLISPNHAMTLRLRLKAGPDGAPVRVIALQDPNTTATHFRKAVTRPGALDFDIADALGPDGRELSDLYFGSDPSDQMALLIDVSLADMEAARAGRYPAEAAGRPRTVDVLRATAAPSATSLRSEMRLRMASELHEGIEDTLVVALWQARDATERLALLRGESLDREDVFAWSVGAGHAQTVRAVLRAAVRADVSLEDRIALLRGTLSTPGALATDIVSKRSPAGIRLLFEAMQMLDLDSSTLRELLLVPDAAGLLPLDIAIDRGEPVTSAFMTALNGLALTRGDRLAILTAAGPEGLPPLLAAMGDDAATVPAAVGAFVDAVVASDLADHQKQRVLLPAGWLAGMRARLAEHPALAAAWQSSIARSALFEVSLALAPPADPRALAAARRLMSAYDATANFSRLSGPEGEADAGNFSACVHAVFRAGIPLQEKRALLTSPDAEGRSLLYRLMTAGAHRHVEILAGALRCGAFGAERLQLLEAWAPGPGRTALTRALEQNHPLVVEAWMRQALPLFAEIGLPAPERERLVQGLPATASGPVRAQATAALESAFAAQSAWARQVARAGSAELDAASQQRLLALVGREALLRAREGRATQAPAHGRPGGPGESGR